MAGGPMTIHLRDDAVPHRVPVPRHLPLACWADMEAELLKQEKLGIIEKVEHVTNWVHLLVVVANGKGGGWRICVDLTWLNRYNCRPYHPLTTPWEAVQWINKSSTYFTTIDAKLGYWQIELGQASQDLMTFIAAWGRYCFKRNPMGLASAQDEYCRQGDDALAGLADIAKVLDDILVYSDDAKTHLHSIIEVLEHCKAHGITLNPKKLQLGQREVEGNAPLC